MYVGGGLSKMAEPFLHRGCRHTGAQRQTRRQDAQTHRGREKGSNAVKKFPPTAMNGELEKQKAKQRKASNSTRVYACVCVCAGRLTYLPAASEFESDN